ncbi:hypothetical protein AMTR_s00009p00264390 [Amborella trichopoda]|uniref:Uncharacterized protein n=1 Tax=Amborella trichopoda TaxID=13333 RepID=W1NHD9_AMBTC|nr:hypothetical protein AMTR_s00009p00264390 [Amborella trichopoda]
MPPIPGDVPGVTYVLEGAPSVPGADVPVPRADVPGRRTYLREHPTWAPCTQGGCTGADGANVPEEAPLVPEHGCTRAAYIPEGASPRSRCTRTRTCARTGRPRGDVPRQAPGAHVPGQAPRVHAPGG